MHDAHRAGYGTGNDSFGAALEGTLAAWGRGGWRRRLLATTALGPVLLMAPIAAWANPVGGIVVGGDAAIQHAPGVTTIDQASQRALINWKQFSIAPAEFTQFRQPGTDAIALNRVVGNDASQIMGALKANGQVWLINPNGILFGPNARIDVHGILATTTDLADRDFMAGRYDFNQPSPNPAASVVNQGAISVGEKGLGALVAPHVRNDGVIAGKLGQVVLAGAETFTLDFYGDGLVQFAATSEVKEALKEQGAIVSNDGTISADGGTVLITAAAASDVVDEVINVSGVVEAKSVAMKDGAIVLDGGDEGIVHVAGTLDASGPGAGEKGGTVKVLGEKVGLFNGARVDASGDAGGGEVLISGNYQGKGPERNAERTVVFKKARLKADALRDGDGGRVIVWADEATRFDGTISARGGAEGGDGGFVEISGKENLSYAGQVDVSAPAGGAGSILFDPENITIIEGGSSNDSLDNEEFQDGFIAFNDGLPIVNGNDLESFTIEDSAVESLSGTVRLQAREDITIDTDLSLSQTAGQSFVLQAGNDILVNGAITTQGGNVHLEADSPHSPVGGADGFGQITISDPITTNGGSLTLIHSGALTISNQLNTGIGATTVGPARDEESSSIQNLGLFINLTSSGPLAFGQATTAGPDGTSVGGLLRTDNSTSIDNDVIVNESFTGSISLIAKDGVIVNNELATSGMLAVNADADNDNVGAISGGGVLESGSGITLLAGGDIGQSTEAGGLLNISTPTIAALSRTGNISIQNSLRDTSVADLSVGDGGLGVSGINGTSVELENTSGSIIVDRPITSSGSVSLNTLNDSNENLENFDIIVNNLIEGQSIILSAGDDITGTAQGQIIAQELEIESLNFVNIDLDQVVSILGQNRIGRLSSFGDDALPFGRLEFRNIQPLTIGGDLGVIAGSVFLQVEGLLTLEQPISTVDAGDAIVLDVGGFVNQAGVGALQAPNGRFLVYSVDPANDTRNIPQDQFSKRYNFPFDPGDPAGSGRGLPPTGDFFLYQVTPELTLAVNPGSDTRVYGDPNPAFTVNIVGLIDDDTSADALSALPVAVAPVEESDVGAYTVGIGPEGLTSPVGYTLIQERGTLEVTPAPLTIQANNASRPFAAANPAFTAAFAGFKLEEGPEVIAGLQFNTPAEPSSQPGDYPIVPFGTTAPNYSISFISGTLTIEDIPPEIPNSTRPKTLLSGLDTVVPLEFNPPELNIAFSIPQTGGLAEDEDLLFSSGGNESFWGPPIPGAP